MASDDRSLGDEVTQAFSPPAAASLGGSLGDQSTHADGMSSVSDLGALAANLDETLELMDLSARYELGAVIGRGGMGEVLLARDKRLERHVAIKRILGEGARSTTALRRFLTEARSLAQLNHFNIVQVYDYGRDTQGPFLILEFVPGKSLHERLKEGPLSTEQVVDLACQLCDGLGAAHERGIIHRDVKPANVLLTERGEPKLTDFGLAHREASDHERTQAGATLGTIDFMPPEQRRDSTQADARSDLWSLAATLYQMLTGKSPKIIRLDQVPEALRPVLGKALEEEPAERYPTTAEFKVALRTASALIRSATPQPSEAVLVEGVCPQCKTQNDLGRKFCRHCRNSLNTSCLVCHVAMKVWDDVCGECGASQFESSAVIRASCEEQLDEAAALGHEYRFDEALAACETISDHGQPALADVKRRATELRERLTANRDEQLQLRQKILQDAQRMFAAYHNESVLKELEKIPQALRNIEVRTLSRKSEERRNKLVDLMTEINRRLKAGHLDDLQSLTSQVLALKPGHTQIAALNIKLLDREDKMRRAVENGLIAAQERYDNSDFSAALRILRSLPKSDWKLAERKQLESDAAAPLVNVRESDFALTPSVERSEGVSASQVYDHEFIKVDEPEIDTPTQTPGDQPRVDQASLALISILRSTNATLETANMYAGLIMLVAFPWVWWKIGGWIGFILGCVVISALGFVLSLYSQQVIAKRRDAILLESHRCNMHPSALKVLIEKDFQELKSSWKD